MSTIKMYLLFLLGKMRRRFFMQIPENERDYQVSRRCFLIDVAVTSTLGAFCGGVLVATLLSYMGVSDAWVGIITSAVAVLSASQLLAIPLTAKIRKRKLFVCTLATLGRMLLGLMLFVPFMDFLSAPLKVAGFLVCYVLAYILSHLFNPPYLEWMNSIISPGERGKFFGMRVAISVASSSAAAFISGILMDAFMAAEKMREAFFLFGTITIVLSVGVFITLAAAREPKSGIKDSEGREAHGRKLKQISDGEKETESFFAQCKGVLKDKNYRPAMFSVVLWAIAYHITWSFISIYLISDLHLTYFYINLMTVIVGILKVLFSSTAGKISDKISYEKMLMIGNGGAVITYLINFFMVPANGKVMYAVFLLLLAICQIAVDPCNTAIQISRAKEGKESAYIAVSSAFSGITVLIASLAGGVVVDFFQVNNFTFLGSHLYGQQVLSLISAGFCAVNTVYLKKTIQKTKQGGYLI